MKKILFLTIPLLLLPVFAFAFGPAAPFGGRIYVTHMPPNVACSGDLIASPFYMIPVGGVSYGPWSKLYGQINIGFITPTAWILGMYRPSEDCVQVDGPEAHPFPTLQTDFYGTSVRKPLPIPAI
jgi:hypothetical protein